MMEVTPEIAIDTVWVLLAAFLVFFMQAGFAMLEAGFSRAKNAINVVLKNLMDFGMASLSYWAVGFALMFGADASGFIGTEGFFLAGTAEQFGLTIPLEAFWLFQVVFAGTAATIVSGVIAERTKFSAYLIFSFLITLFIYPVVGHWIWGGGWLANMGFQDFAGSTVVHSVGAWAGLAGALVIGPRLGRFEQNGHSEPMPGHNTMLAALGTLILWFGWFGFNPGSTIAGTDLSIALIAANTNLAAAAGAVAALFTSWIAFGQPKADMALNGAIAGLVAITAPCAYVDPWAAVVIGLIAGPVVVGSIRLLENWHVDDVVGAVSAHGTVGVWGTLSVGIFDTTAGLVYGGGFSLIGTQIIGVVAVFIWTFALSWLAFKLIDGIVGVRVSPEEEERGLDLGEHGQQAYPGFAPSDIGMEIPAKAD